MGKQRHQNSRVDDLGDAVTENPICLSRLFTFFSFFFFNFFFQHLFIFGTERDRAWTGERQRERDTHTHRIWSRLQALSCQHRAWCGLELSTCEIMTWAEVRCLASPPGSPPYTFLMITSSMMIVSRSQWRWRFFFISSGHRRPHYVMF